MGKDSFILASSTEATTLHTAHLETSGNWREVPILPGYMISLAHVAACNGESKKELDSGFQTVDSGFQVLDSLPVERHRDSGFF